MTGSGRTLLWRDALPMVARYAAHGCGPEAFLLAFRPYQSAELERREPYALFDSAHNVALDAAITTGLAGLATLVALVALAASGLARRFRAAPRGAARALPLGVAVALVGWAAGGLFVFDTIATALYFYVFVALGSVNGERSTVNGKKDRLFLPFTVHRSLFTLLLLVAALGVAVPRLRLVWLADRQMATALALARDGRLAEAVGHGRAAVSNGEALGPAPELSHLLARVYARAGDPARA